MAATIVDRLYEEFVAIVESLGEEEVSLRNTAEEVFRKALLLAAASHFEKRVVESLQDATHIGANGDELICELVTNKLLERQYHTFFDWKGRNANTFFSLFGDGFATYMKREVVPVDGMEEAIRAFLQLGNDRNRLVHQDFGNFSLEKTAAEIHESYKKGAKFVDALNECFAKYRELLRGQSQEDSASDAPSQADVTNTQPADAEQKNVSRPTKQPATAALANPTAEPEAPAASEPI